MDKSFLIYGAYGYTGRLITELAAQKKLTPLLSGRSEAPLQALANKFGMDYQAVDLSESSKLLALLDSVDLVLNIAGPYSATAERMVKACLETKTHYLDITGELEVFEWIATQDEAAQRAGIVLLPGTGFDVVPSDCLAAYLKDLMPQAVSLELAIQAIGELSRGTTLTMLENIHKGGYIRKDGKLKNVPASYRSRRIDFGHGVYHSVSIPWGDVSTAYYSTGIPNITVYMAADAKMRGAMTVGKYFGWMMGLSPIQELLKAQVKRTMDGPSEKHREKSRSYLWGEARDAEGKIQQARLETPEGYKLTAETALESALRVLNGQVEAGFHTPATAFGMNYILDFAGTHREKL